jgi:hypothetical protein
MPRQDGTGPTGKGPKTGRGVGSCDTGSKSTKRGFGKGQGSGRGIGRRRGTK